MSVLILQRNPLEPFPYDRWLEGYEGDIVMLAARDRIELFAERAPDGDGPYTRLELLDSFADARLVEERARALAEEFAVTRIIAHHEMDVELAARLREERDLPGPWPADVLPYRDKALMKERLRETGVEVAPHTVPATAADAVRFAGEHGLPVVFKERAGCNSIGLRIARDPEVMRDCLAEAFADGDRDDLLLEAFVPGRMCHVDGLVAGGRTVLAWPSQYQYDLASYGSDPGARIDLTLGPDDPLTGRLLALAEEAVGALRGPRMTDHAFHAEIFHTPDDRLVLCEIACRPGGAKIREVFETIFGINHGGYAARAEVGLPLPVLAAVRDGGPAPRPAKMAGQVLMMKRPGRIAAVPEVPGDPWVERFWLYGRPGQVVPAASGSSDFLAAAVCSGPTRAESECRLRALGARFEAQVQMVQDVGPDEVEQGMIEDAGASVAVPAGSAQ